MSSWEDVLSAYRNPLPAPAPAIAAAGLPTTGRAAPTPKNAPRDAIHVYDPLRHGWRHVERPALDALTKNVSSTSLASTSASAKPRTTTYTRIFAGPSTAHFGRRHMATAASDSPPAMAVAFAATAVAPFATEKFVSCEDRAHSQRRHVTRPAAPSPVAGVDQAAAASIATANATRVAQYFASLPPATQATWLRSREGGPLCVEAGPHFPPVRQGKRFVCTK